MEAKVFVESCGSFEVVTTSKIPQTSINTLKLVRNDKNSSEINNYLSCACFCLVSVT